MYWYDRQAYASVAFIAHCVQGLFTSIAAIGVGSAAGLPDVPSLLKDISSVSDKLDQLHEIEAQHADLMTTVKVFRELHEAIAHLHAEATATTVGYKGVSLRERCV